MVAYHVRITVNDQDHDEVKTDMDEDSLERQILQPYREANPITINGKVLQMGDIERIRISESDEPSNEIIERLKVEDRSSRVLSLGGPTYAWRAAARANDVTDQFITGPPGASIPSPHRIATSEDSESVQDPRSSVDANSVFVITGRDTKATSAVVAMLRSMNIRIVEWQHAIVRTGLPNPYVGDVVETGLKMASAALVILSPDDLVMLRSDLLNDADRDEERSIHGQARPNVFYEAGFADALGRERTVIVEVGNPKSFTDISGRHVVQYDGSAGKRNALAERLRLAGVEVDTSGEEWLSVGDLGPALEAVRANLSAARGQGEPGPLGEDEGCLDEIDRLLEFHSNMRARSRTDDLSDLPDESLDLVIRAQAVIDRCASSSTYSAEAAKVALDRPHVRLPVLVSALRTLKAQLEQ